MRPMKLDEDIRPLSEFRAEIASFVKRVNDTKRPLVLTQHGRGAVVVVDIVEYAAMRERLETIDDIAAARAQLAASELIDADELRSGPADKRVQPTSGAAS